MRRALLLAALVLLATAPTAAAAPFHWVDAFDVAVAPDGRHVYAAGGQTLSFTVLEGGALELIGHTEPGAFESQIAISPDGRFVYVGRGQPFPKGGIYVMIRDPATGLLTHQATFVNEGAPGLSPLGAIADIEMAPDGRQLYVAQRNPELVTVFDRDPGTGALTQRQAVYKPDLPTPSALDLALTADGRHLYVSGDGTGLLQRDPVSGMLSGGTAFAGYSDGQRVAIGPDGRRVYVGTSRVDSFRRNADTGALEHLSTADVAPPKCLCGSGAFLSAAPDGRSVFSGTAPHASLAQADVTDDGLSFTRHHREGENGITGIDHPSSMAWSPDGRYAFVTATREHKYGSIASFRRTQDGLDFAGAIGPRIDVAAPWGVWQRPAITVDDGAIYTNKRDVQVTVTNPNVISSLRLSNSADFAGSSLERLTATEQTYAWRLAGSGPEREVKRVYVRFTPLDGAPVEMFDDVILDERPPEVQQARIQGRRLLLKARDNRSGVKRLQVTTSRKKPGKVRSYKRSLPVGAATRLLHVRVIDGAGNTSKWRIARRG